MKRRHKRLADETPVNPAVPPEAEPEAPDALEPPEAEPEAEPVGGFARRD